ncbi:2-succinyl-5-enolpyruvyl-6-hydroxy-3-cyclohexene-1-carboxylate synthase [Euzebyella saccharophila]|uniref:2-succinyl-5-enolpyruvyl-6-hydroxy-3-cyclohexene-1-carboxylate synthase n=1 Tax=Euzebyella saccharophila TaxID=679664 RepID=A0ABV8JUJ2_9FLAO|nr:2-succinyl-5-enolpyruvyl-6-hydroxy-3-cyclohexene-1-carboxylate synthase [Euzebyella saccharophila]
MIHSSIPAAQLVVQHFKAKKIKNIVISPGSRNAPLIIGFTEDPYFKCFSIVDERSAAFFALGMAQQLQVPVATLCSSGSALLNYYPAIAEAYYSGIPLVIISADRPPYKIDVGDGQTIRQDHVFHRHIGYSANLKQDVSHCVSRVEKYAPQWLENGTVEENQDKVKAYNDSELNKALNVALQVKVPVHINVPFEEPLYDRLEGPSTTALIVLPEAKEDENFLSGDLLDTWNAASRKMVLVGVHPPNAVEQQLLDKLAADPSVIVLTETTSNLHHPRFFSSIDSILAPIEKSANKTELFQKLQPDILLTFGGLVVSKKIKAFLRDYKPQHHWHVDEVKAFDTFFALTKHIRASANEFLRNFISESKNVNSDYFGFWNTRKVRFEVKRLEYLNQIPFSDFSAFKQIIETIPRGSQVHLSNSSTVRYAQLFPLHPSLKVYCNRGTSGIDGSTSTAVGGSICEQDPTLLITGDLSFFYDSNGLWNNYIKPDFRVILVNNSGGGIFRILPGKEETGNFETFFETSHHMNAAHLGAQFGFQHIMVNNEEDLQKNLEIFYEKSDSPKILEVVTPRLLNNKILLGYFDFIS